jgi:hypothetical protein
MGRNVSYEQTSAANTGSSDSSQNKRNEKKGKNKQGNQKDLVASSSKGGRASHQNRRDGKSNASNGGGQQIGSASTDAPELQGGGAADHPWISSVSAIGDAADFRGRISGAVDVGCDAGGGPTCNGDSNHVSGDVEGRIPPVRMAPCAARATP